MRPEDAQAAASGGRRREALLARAPAPVTEEPLGAADVARLAAHRSPEERARIARKLGRGLQSFTEPRERALVEAVLALLVKDVAVEVRKALAEAVADREDVPSWVVRRLARDEIEVAEPVLEKSPLLSDEELVAIVQTNAMQYALAVAGRSRLSEVVCAALLDRGETPVAAKLVGNPGAQLSRAALERVLAEHGRDRTVRDRLVRRPELPFELIEKLVRLVAERLEWELVENMRLPLATARAIVRAARERSTIDLLAREHGPRGREQALAERWRAGELDHEALLAMLREGDVAGFEIGVALHAGEPLGRVRRLLYDADRRRLAAVCLKAGFPFPHYLLVRMALELAEAAVEGRPARSDYGPATVRFLAEQYQKLAADRDRLALLLAV
ncbi:MAG: DUF2336 domain-containing protein [Geminicoccaceae bacterium]|nr:DUF2336 domain-containing protein [Geminicoccaceae bacterium]MCS7268809.1 DUF2336 domain-containing protein [Geminicoccaceae bacterium]MDW8124645.1 DUF2336 domain-containing protein [Geminicoccaceae bacterium]MDW8342544.1 DUF2336 domain-containing protein [Geminicoccaceae bacterium]